MRRGVKYIKPPTIDSQFAYTNFKNFHEHTGMSRCRWDYYRRSGKIKIYYVPKFIYKLGEFKGYSRIYAFDHSEVRKYERRF